VCDWREWRAGFPAPQRKKQERLANSAEGVPLARRSGLRVQVPKCAIGTKDTNPEP